MLAKKDDKLAQKFKYPLKKSIKKIVFMKLFLKAFAKYTLPSSAKNLP